jgi:hypothetical protein
VGLHIHFRKEEKVSSEQTESGKVEHWNMVIEDAYFTSNGGERVKRFPAGVQSVLLAADLEAREEFTDTHLIQHFEVQEDTGLFAHMALVRLLSFRAKEEESIRWRAHIADDRTIRSIEGFRDAATRALDDGVVRYVLNIRPKTMPAFLTTE